jgi:hypothetical protein
MKIFTTLSTFAAGSSYQQPKYEDFLERVSDGQKSAGWVSAFNFRIFRKIG